MSPTFVIVGAGLAGAKAAETLREEGYDGRLVLVGQEPERPYERPPLSKDHLRGEVGLDKVYVHGRRLLRGPRDRAADRAAVTAIDTAAPRVMLADGERFPGTGCSSRPAPSRAGCLPGADLDGVLYLRTLADADTCARYSTPEAGSWWSARAGSARRPPPRRAARDGGDAGGAAGGAARARPRADLGRLYARPPPEHGVEFRRGPVWRRSRARARGARPPGRRAHASTARAVLVAVGVAPRTALAAAAGSRSTTGSSWTPPCATERRGVFAAGDIANADAPLLRRAGARGALGQRPQPGAGRRAQHAGPGRGLRPRPLLLLRPVRRGDGVRGPQPAGSTTSCSAAISRGASSSPSGCATGASRRG